MMDDDRTVTVRIPLVFKKHGGRKTVISQTVRPGRRYRRSRPHSCQGGRARLPLAEAARRGGARHAR